MSFVSSLCSGGEVERGDTSTYLAPDDKHGPGNFKVKMCLQKEMNPNLKPNFDKYYVLQVDNPL